MDFGDHGNDIEDFGDKSEEIVTNMLKIMTETFYHELWSLKVKLGHH